MIINGIKLNDVKVDKSEKTELSERDNKIIGWVSLALATLLLIAFFLGGFFSPVKASAGELVGGDVPIETPYDNYFVVYSSVDDNGLLNNVFIFANCNPSGYNLNPQYSEGFSSLSLSGLIKILEDGNRLAKANSSSDTSRYADYANYYSSFDFSYCGKSFQKAPCLIHKEMTVGGLQAPEIATVLTSQIVGLVPLALGLLVLAIGLWKGLKHLRQTLSRA